MGEGLAKTKGCFVKDRVKRREYERRYYAKNASRIKERNRRLYEKNVGNYARKHARSVETLAGRAREWAHGAKRRGIPWNLTLEYLKTLPEICDYTGSQLSYKVGRPDTISLDRKDSSRPYEPGNVCFCCSYINRMKGSMTPEDFLSSCRKVWEFGVRVAENR